MFFIVLLFLFRLLHSFFYFFFFFFFFNDTATTEIYTLSLHDALPISQLQCRASRGATRSRPAPRRACNRRSEEHTSELQSLTNLVCRLLLEKKKKKIKKKKTIKTPVTNKTKKS